MKFLSSNFIVGRLKPWLIICLLVMNQSFSRADYFVSLSSAGSSELSLFPGQDLALDVVLASSPGDSIGSAVFQIEMSSPGLIYNSYLWVKPFRNGTLDDDSKPLLGELPLMLAAKTLEGPGHPADTVDLELANVVDSTNHFQAGKLVTLNFSIPSNMAPGRIIFTPVVDTFADGFTVVPASAGENFQLTVNDPRTQLSISANGTNGTVSLKVTGLPGKAVELQSTTNFRSWSKVSSLLLPNGSATITRTNISTTPSALFYRTVE